MSLCPVNRQGFTLIELLVVLGIISLLMGIMLPCLGHAREQGQRAVCQANLRQLAVAHAVYQDSFDGFVVPATQEGGGYSYWYNRLGPYFSQENIDALDELIDGAGRSNLRCPRDQTAYPTLLSPHGEEAKGWLSYALNSQPSRNMRTGAKVYAGMGGHRLFHIRRPAETLLHCDFAYRSWVGDVVALLRNQYAAEPGAHYDKLPGYPDQNRAIETAYRHQQRMNVLWGDGHVTLLEDILYGAEKNAVFWGPVYDSFKRKETGGMGE